MSLRRRLLIILISLTTIPILALGTTLTLQNIRNQIREITRNQQAVASEIALQSTDILKQVELEASLLTYESNLLELSKDELKVLLTGFMSFEGNIQQITLLDMRGWEITRVSKSQIITDDELIDRSTDTEFTKPYNTGVTYFSPIRISEATNEPLITVSLPVTNSRTGSVEGILIMDVKMVIIWDLVESKARELDKEIFITTTDGIIVAHPNRSVVLRNDIYILPANENIAPGLDGNTSIIGSKSFLAGEQEFIVIVMEPASNEYGKVAAAIGITLATICITSILVIFLAIRFGNTISKPIVNLAKKAQSMEAGKFEESDDTDRNDEIGVLATSFNSMSQKIRQNITTLTALQNATVSIVNDLEMEQVIKAIMNQVTQLLGIQDCFIYLVEPDESGITLQFGTGINVNYIGSTLHPGVGLPSQVWKTGKPLSLENYDTWPGRAKIFDTTPFHAIAAAPLKTADKVVGVLGVNFIEKNRSIPKEALELLEKFAPLASIAFSNAKVYQLAQEEIIERKKAEIETLRQLERVKSLHKIDISITSTSSLNMTLQSVLDEVTTHIKVDAATILLFNPIMNTFELAGAVGFKTDPRKKAVPRAQAGLAGLVSQHERTVFRKDLADDVIYASGLFDINETFESYYGIPLFIKGELKGVLEAYQRTEKELSPENLEFLETLATQAAIAIDNNLMFHNLQETNKNLQIAYETTLEGWSAALDLRDKETEGHTLRVTELTLKLARMLGIQDRDLLHIRRGALLHDIGKMGIPDRILQKPDKLTDDERKTIEQHPVYAFNLLSPIPYLQPSLDIPYCHHEKWDGTGYPRKLKGEKIPFAARLFAVVDVYDAVTSNRPYRDGWDKQKAIEYIKDQSGKHFDPQIVEIFLQMIDSVSESKAQE